MWWQKYRLSKDNRIRFCLFDGGKMKDSNIESWKDKDKDFLIAHYREVSNESRAYDRLIWEIPSIAIVILGALFTAAYVHTPPSILLRTVLTGFAALWAFGVIVFAKKHEFFNGIQKKRLMRLEDEAFEIINLQRLSDPKKYKKLEIKKSHWEEPKGLQHLGAHHTLNGILWIMFLSAVSLTILNFISLLTVHRTF
jgi:hypothetical protein